MRICRIISTILVLTIGILLSACGNAQGNANTSATYQVAPSFREFYETLGGENVLGAAISKNFTMQSYECQYTVNSLMCINPLVTDASRFFLYPLGDSMNVSEDPAQSPAQSGDQVVNGYTIYYEFTPLYNQLSAERYVGKPLTQAHLNYSQNRIEQFFQNVGFYRKFSDPAGTVHLLAYGAYSCTDDCNYTPSVEAAIINASKASSDQP